jgi:hypothetical protein
VRRESLIRERSSSAGTMRALRVSLLLVLLVAVVVYAAHDVLSRRARNEWKRTLDVAFVVVTQPGVDTAAVAALRSRVPDLAARLTSELHRYRPDAPAPFAFTLYGPAPLVEPLPVPEDGLLGAVKYAYGLHRFTSDVDGRLGVPGRGFDARLYLVLSAPTDRAVVEGMSEHGGRIGVARAELDPHTLDNAHIVAAHQHFHTLGASDHYGPDGRALVPDGLAEPDRSPLYPQEFAEIMARNRPVSPASEERPESLAELAVGPSTAREVGWTR